MKKSNSRTREHRDLTIIIESRRRLLHIAVLFLMLGSVSLAVVVRPQSKNALTSGVAKVATVPASIVATSDNPSRAGQLQDKLMFQPDANKMRRRLGKRFLRSGPETTIAVGVLTVGTERQSVKIIRTQDEDQGEQVNVAFGANPPSLAWSPRTGALSNGKPAEGNEKKIIERIVLDSSDQFILAQRRGASYYRIARGVIPEDEDETSSPGAPWDLIRISEPRNADFAKPESEWRIYFISVATGLIDRISYQDQSEVVVKVDLSGWVNIGGELAPELIRWTLGGEIVMELNVTAIAYSKK